MSLADNIKQFRLQKGLQQKQVALEINLSNSHYNKIENGQREASIDVVDKLAKLYNTTIDSIVHLDTGIPTEVTVVDKTLTEQVRLISELDDKDKALIFSMIDKLVTSKKFKDFFTKNADSL